MLGQLNLQVDDFWPALSVARQNGVKEMICPFAAWINGEPGEQHLVAELQPPYRPKPKPIDNVITVDEFLTEIHHASSLLAFIRFTPRRSRFNCFNSLT